MRYVHSEQDCSSLPIHSLYLHFSLPRSLSFFISLFHYLSQNKPWFYVTRTIRGVQCVRHLTHVPNNALFVRIPNEVRTLRARLFFVCAHSFSRSPCLILDLALFLYLSHESIIKKLLRPNDSHVPENALFVCGSRMRHLYSEKACFMQPPKRSLRKLRILRKVEKILNILNL